MELFGIDGDYNYRSFIGASGTWTLIETEAKKSVKSSLDSFKSDKGEYKTYKREQVMDQFKLGNITPVEKSKIEFKSYSKAEWDRKTGRKK